jgi:hypothetical protein
MKFPLQNHTNNNLVESQYALAAVEIVVRMRMLTNLASSVLRNVKLLTAGTSNATPTDCIAETNHPFGRCQPDS